MTDTFVIDRFGGLNLTGDPEEVGFNGALDLLNVDFDRNGRLRTRDGYEQHTDVEGTNAYDSLFQFGSGILAGANTRLELLGSGGAISATSTAPTAFPHYAVTFGGTAGTAMYIANGTDQLRKLAGTTFSTPAGLSLMTEKFLAVQTPDNRLVAAKGNRVYFSAPGDPETFDRSDPGGDWVDITPGDGESITGMVAWNHLLFVFKPSKFAVFTGNSTDGVGGSLFNFRLVNSGIGAVSSAIVATPAGVIFGHYSGIYRTIGDTPVSISDPIEPLFRGRTPEAYQGGPFLRSLAAATYADRRVYFTVTRTTLAKQVLVYDIDDGWWTIWNLPAGALLADSEAGALYFAYAQGTKHIGKQSSDSTTDNGTAVAWRHRTGYSDLGVPLVKRVGELSVWGSGSVTAKVAVDHEDLDTGSSLTLGTAPVVSEVRQQVARRGLLLGVELSGSGPATVHRVGLFVRGQRVAGVK